MNIYLKRTVVGVTLPLLVAGGFLYCILLMLFTGLFLLATALPSYIATGDWSYWTEWVLEKTGMGRLLDKLTGDRA